MRKSTRADCPPPERCTIVVRRRRYRRRSHDPGRSHASRRSKGKAEGIFRVPLSSNPLRPIETDEHRMLNQSTAPTAGSVARARGRSGGRCRLGIIGRMRHAAGQDRVADESPVICERLRVPATGDPLVRAVDAMPQQRRWGQSPSMRWLWRRSGQRRTAGGDIQAAGRNTGRGCRSCRGRWRRCRCSTGGAGEAIDRLGGPRSWKASPVALKARPCW